MFKKERSKSMKHVFNDMIVSPAILIDSNEDGKVRARWKATQANVHNDNDRLYPFNVMNDGVEESNEAVSSGRMIGESPHPKAFTNKRGQVVFDTSIDNTVIKIYNQFVDKTDGSVYIDAEVLDTAKGKDLQALIKAGVPVGISMRALGDSVRKRINGVMVDVATKLKILSYDVVMNPATPGCEVISVLTDSQVEEVLNDGVTTTTPVCPSCNAELTPQDPDGDGDIDYYTCEPCQDVYVSEEYQSASINVSQNIRKLGSSEYDSYKLARNHQFNAVNTDGQEGEVEDMKLEDILKAMKDSEEFKSLVEEQAKAIAQPALDAVAAQKSEEEKAKAFEQAKAETKAFADSKIEELKGKVPEEVLFLMSDSVKEATDKDVVTAIIDSMTNLYSKTSSVAKLDSVGFNGTNTGEGGHVRVEVTHEHKPWGKQVQTLLDSFDRIGDEFGHQHDPSVRKYNQKVVSEIMDKFEKTIGYEAMKDSVAMVDSMIATDAVSVTTSQLLNQPTVQQALLIQSFQDVESMQFLAPEVFEGSEVRWPVETFTSANTVNPQTGLQDILVAEGSGIPESVINLAWLSYAPQWRKNAISLSTEAVKTLASGPAKYDAITRGIYHIGYDKRRKLDNLAYLEMVMASDEYKPQVVASEVATAGAMTSVSNGTNVNYKYNLTLGGTATGTAGTNPIVRPRVRTQLNAAGQMQTTTINPFTITISAAQKTMGYLDANGNVQSGDYAVDFENGIVYFANTSGANTTTGLPTFAYSGVTNYVRWATTVPGGTTAEAYYNTLLQLITAQANFMGSAPRFNKPNLGIMSLNASQYIENASIWYKLNQPDLGSLTGGGTSNMFGTRSGVNFARINAPWVAGDNRILLTQKGATRYAIETPYQIEGPYPKYDNNGNIVDAKVFYGRENSVMATPQTVDSTGAILNPKSRSIKLV
jgi:hypothetical protein